MNNLFFSKPKKYRTIIRRAHFNFFLDRTKETNEIKDTYKKNNDNRV